MPHKNYLIKYLIQILTFLYLFSLIFHAWDFYSIRISEIIFLFLLLISIIGYLKKIIFVEVEISDLFISFYLLVNIILFFLGDFTTYKFKGLAVSLYLFLIYFLFKNISKNLSLIFIIKSITLTVSIGSLFGIIGWIAYQLDIQNMLAYERNYPFSIGKPILATSFYGTQNLFAFSNVLAIFLVLIFENKNIYSILKIIILSFGLIFTFSKTIVLFFGIIILFILKFSKKQSFKLLIVFSSLMFISIHSFLTNFLILDKSKENKWLNNKYTHMHIQPIYENKKIKIILTNYYFLKEKSIKIAKENFYKGIGYENFRKQKNYPILIDQKPHSVYFGALAEHGVFGLISVLIILIYNFYFSYFKQKNLMYILILYSFFFGIDADLFTLKLIWIIFAINISLNNNKNQKFL